MQGSTNSNRNALSFDFLLCEQSSSACESSQSHQVSLMQIPCPEQFFGHPGIGDEVGTGVDEGIGDDVGTGEGTGKGDEEGERVGVGVGTGVGTGEGDGKHSGCPLVQLDAHPGVTKKSNSRNGVKVYFIAAIEVF